MFLQTQRFQRSVVLFLIMLALEICEIDQTIDSFTGTGNKNKVVSCFYSTLPFKTITCHHCTAYRKYDEWFKQKD